ncbi:uncharacterized protein N7459_003604 [Penicillium hispanicum]|uniref:uncharacterized protein n=1 Tax=Penicillium hispanicum TaxID=1080232 RepID=UPI0025412CAD|nr:uncharacterized protein N7459_003604 [Penicillium hispanicum]KAJ5587839.1 hypothetical protein N7459_003604 [Penicillium hispanicum]
MSQRQEGLRRTGSRWKKECTFKWLSSKRAESKGHRRRTDASTAGAHPSHTPPSVVTPYGVTWAEGPRLSEWYPTNPGGMLGATEPTNCASLLNLTPPVAGGLDGGELDQYDFFSWSTDIPHGWPPRAVTEGSEETSSELESQAVIPDLIPSSFQTTPETDQQFEDGSKPSSFEFAAPGYKYPDHAYSVPEQNYRSASSFEWRLCTASGDTTRQYARSTMTSNLIRIYHDSMENALSCWLTEHNCPYSGSNSNLLTHTKRKEWGPSWSNRMCIRVCQLDRASSSIRGRALSAKEDQTAARALHLAIMAFASQWTQHAQKGTGLSVPESIAHDERSIRERVWNEARHALEESAGIPSFRIIFANIIFSLTQRPLDNEQDELLGQLLENDSAPRFLEAANRQLFTFRHKLARLKREALPSTRELRKASIGSMMSDMLEVPNPSGSSQGTSILTSSEHQSTLSLLFWLGVMFDTLSSAMYQRPLVVSDEDSQIASASASLLDSADHVDTDGWNIPRNRSREKQDVWGDFFLRGPVERPYSQAQPRWPCSYEEAASVLSEATPVKVLLYRRVTQLQTLIYRGAYGDRLEEVIQKTLLVYQHWNCTYQRFMLDCVAHHDLLPPRIQSWYVILDCHWHLAAMLLADAVESIDHGRLGSETKREAREVSGLISALRIDNALAVGALARSSLQGQEPTMHRHFHDSLNEVAFLVEPWTVVLIHSFAKAGYISLNSFRAPRAHGALAECFRQNCLFCIRALQYLGRKSDMAFLVARNLSRSLDPNNASRFP